MHGENEDPGIISMLSLMFYISLKYCHQKAQWIFNQDVNSNIHCPLRSTSEWLFHAWLPELTSPVSKSSTSIDDSILHLTADIYLAR